MAASGRPRVSLGFALVTVLSAATFSAQSRPEPALEDVVRKMGEYVAAYGQRAALLVAEEKYTQQVATEDDTPLRPFQLTAEVAIVKAPGGTGWIGFRDVVEVNGKPLVDRKDRLMRLLSDPDGDASEARRISDESSRFNIGPVTRNFNVPTTVLFFFHPGNLSRFSFTRKGTKTVDGVQAWVLDFTETRRPTMMMTRAGKDVPCEGTVWVVPQNGTVVHTRVRLRGFADEKRASTPEPAAGSASTGYWTIGPAPSVRNPTGGASSAPTALPGAGESLAEVEVTYHRDAGIGIWVPVKMSEVYEGARPRGASKPSLFERATCVAEYRNYKRFETSAKIVAPR
jgi:hypothetical protein